MPEQDKVRVAKVNPDAPIKDMHMAMCINCGAPIIEIIGITPYSHMATGHELCDAPPLSQAQRDAALAMMPKHDE